MTEVMTAAQYHSRFHGKGKRAKPQQRESHLQQACVKWFRLQYPNYDDLLFSLPNEGKRTAINGARLKAMGMVKGVPDLFLSMPSVRYHGLYIELKVLPNTLTKQQQFMIERLRRNDYRVEVCYSLEDFRNVIKWYIS